MPNINLRLPDDLHAALKAIAERDERSLNSEIIWILRSRIEQQDHQS
jgi:predicted HicB family RNase H-like nuclease